MTILSTYEKYTDKDIVDLIVKEHRQEALVYLLYDRYYKDAKYYAFLYYDSLEYLDDLMEELVLNLMGNKGDYAPLASFKWQSSFRTWISRVISNLFLKKRNDLIGFGKNGVNIGETTLYSMPSIDTQDRRMVMLLEAIARLKDPDYKFILIKELEGYKPQEICRLLEMKRKAENRVKLDKDNNEIIPSVPYIYMIKSRALKEIKEIMKTINS